MRQLLQDLQDDYSELLGTSIIIVNKRGQLITKPSTTNRLSKRIIQDRAINEKYIEKLLVPYLKINSTIAFDATTIPYVGLKFFLTPIDITGISRQYFIIAGPIIDCSSVKEVLTSNNVLSEELIKEIEEVRITEEGYINHSRLRLERFSNFVKELFISDIRNDLEQKLNRINQLIDSTDLKDLSSIKMIAEQIFDVYNSKSDPRNTFKALLEAAIFGIAQPVSPDQYKIVFGKGENAIEIIGDTFYIGEGFLGQAVARNENTHWNDISEDPRNMYFKKKGIMLTKLVCIPIRYNAQNFGLFFAGLKDCVLPSEHYIQHTNLIADRIAAKLTLKNTNDKKNMYYNERVFYKEYASIITKQSDPDVAQLQLILD